jgi:hypothetical protein
MDFFRSLAERSVVGTWKDGATILWHKPFVSEWVLRMQALGVRIIQGENHLGPEVNSEFPNGWTDAAIVALCHKFGAEYCILPVSQATQLPVVFQGKEGYKVIKIPMEITSGRIQL